jgi:hypothetical protein
VLGGHRAPCGDAGGPASGASRGPALSPFGGRGRTRRAHPSTCLQSLEGTRTRKCEEATNIATAGGWHATRVGCSADSVDKSGVLSLPAPTARRAHDRSRFWRTQQPFCERVTCGVGALVRLGPGDSVAWRRRYTGGQDAANCGGQRRSSGPPSSSPTPGRLSAYRSMRRTELHRRALGARRGREVQDI